MEQALARLPEQPCRLLDLGNGAIALALASERPDCEIIAVNSMPDAVVPWHNVMPNIWRSKIIHILQSDWFSALAGQQFAMIVSNPPYIDEQDPHLQQGDVRFEPLTALVAADGGMADIVHIIEQSRNALVSGGFLLLEHGWQQGEAVRQAFILAGYHSRNLP
ncbi:HemK family protein methyltransferase [Escherichia coli]